MNANVFMMMSFYVMARFGEKNLKEYQKNGRNNKKHRTTRLGKTLRNLL